MDNSKYHDLDPTPCILILSIIVFAHKKVSLMVIVNIHFCNINVYKRVNFILDHVYMYTIYINIFIHVCMYVCICKYIHVNVCHVYIVCHLYIYTCVYLVRVDLDSILLVVSDGDDDNAKRRKSLFENLCPNPSSPPHWARMFASHTSLRGPGSSDIPLTLGRKLLCRREKIRDFEPMRIDLCPTGGSPREGEGNENYWNATFTVSVPGINHPQEL